MWCCVKCRESLDDTFYVCWNCGTAKDGTEDPTFCKDENISDETEETVADPLFCIRCNHALNFIGTKKFHEGTLLFDVAGGFSELFKNREHFDVYMCPHCGRLEFFAEGVGEEFRPTD